MTLWLHGLLALSAICAATGQVLFKIGAAGARSLPDFVNPGVAGGLVAYGVGTLLWIYALSKAPLTVVYPYTAVTFVLVYLAGAFILREPVPIRAIGGLLLVMGGLFLINAQGVSQ
jgi:drug/metabolite transporter (DMT)-like permease